METERQWRLARRLRVSFRERTDPVATRDAEGNVTIAVYQ